MELQNQISLEKNQALQDKVMEVMVEGPSTNDDKVWTGHTLRIKSCFGHIRA